jgi:hypothetical protein
MDCHPYQVRTAHSYLCWTLRVASGSVCTEPSPTRGQWVAVMLPMATMSPDDGDFRLHYSPVDSLTVVCETHHLPNCHYTVCDSMCVSVYKYRHVNESNIKSRLLAHKACLVPETQL